MAPAIALHNRPDGLSLSPASSRGDVAGGIVLAQPSAWQSR